MCGQAYAVRVDVNRTKRLPALDLTWLFLSSLLFPSAALQKLHGVLLAELLI